MCKCDFGVISTFYILIVCGGWDNVTYNSVVSSGNALGTVDRLFSRQSTMPSAQRHGCGHSIAAPHSMRAFSVRPAPGTAAYRIENTTPPSQYTMTRAIRHQSKRWRNIKWWRRRRKERKREKNVINKLNILCSSYQNMKWFIQSLSRSLIGIIVRNQFQNRF